LEVRRMMDLEAEWVMALALAAALMVFFESFTREHRSHL
jgi:hypothetical protein